LKNKNKLCPFKKLSVFYNNGLKTFGSHLVLLVFILHPLKCILYICFNNKFPLKVFLKKRLDDGISHSETNCVRT
jgi:hypothetical protein